MSGILDYLEPWVRRALSQGDGPVLLFVSGAQGIGKSWALRDLLAKYPDTIAGLSLDDFYLTRAERRALASDVDPLFETRGPPGTHDVALLNGVLDALMSAGSTARTQIPVFDKTIDDRADRSRWNSFTGRPEAIIVEGWLMGVDSDPDAARAPPLNAVEARDASGLWRGYQEQQLAGVYAALWDRADGYFHVDAPGFEAVRTWRLEQEGTTLGIPAGALPPARQAWVSDFIQHYERLTRRMLAGKRRAGAVLSVDAHRQVKSFAGQPD